MARPTIPRWRTSASTGPPRGPALLPIVALAAVAVCHQVIGRVASGDVRLVLLNLLQLAVASAAAGYLAMRARRAPAGTRVHLVWLSAGVGAWALGQGYWTVAQVLLHQSLPFPSWADLGFVLLYPCLFFALLFAPSSRMHQVTHRRRTSDAVAVVSSLLFLLWSTALLSPILNDVVQRGDPLAAVGLGYPTGDVLLLGVLGVLLRGARRSWSGALRLYGLALVLLLVADVGFSHLVRTDSYETGSWVDLGWLGCFILLAVGSHSICAGDDQEVLLAAQGTRWTRTVPLLALGIAAAVAMVESADGDLQRQPLLVGLLSIVFGTAVLRASATRSEDVVYATQFEHVQQSLREVQGSYDFALAAAGMVSLTWTADGNRVEAGENAHEVLDLPVYDTASGAVDPMSAIPDLLRAGVRAACAAVSPLELDIDVEVPTPDGPRHLHVRGELQYATGGDVTGLRGVCFDVTGTRQRVRAEAQRTADRTALALLSGRLSAASREAALDDSLVTLAGLVGAVSVELTSDGSSVAHWPPRRGRTALEPGGPAEPRHEVPVPVGGEPWGVLTLQYDDGSTPSARVAELASAVASLVGQAVERSAAAEALWHGAHYDPLTGLPNRTWLSQYLRDALASSADELLAVAYLDLDDFKSVNDRFGHPVGDALLKVVAGRLQAALRTGDVVAGMGGDEFAIVMTGLRDRTCALEVTSRIQAALAVPVDLGPLTVQPHASIGVASTADSGRDVHELLRNADLAMIAAKRRRNSDAVLYDSGLLERATTEGDLADSLQGALDRGEMLLHYQPVVDLMTGRLCGAEALVRWLRPGHRLQAPDTFLPTMVRVGLMPALSRFVLGEACDWAARYVALHPGEPFMMAVNVTADDMIDPHFDDAVRQALRQSGLEPWHLSLEIVESGALTDVETVGVSIAGLRELGVTIAIDDFGTGWSSFAQLKSLAVDVVKIDKSFINGLGTQLDDSALVAALVGTAHALGLSVIAEGVETAQQRASLVLLGCEMAQGYLFGRPVGARPEHFGVGTAEAGVPEPRPSPESRPRLRTVVIADDLEDDRRLLERYLNRSGTFQVVGSAADGAAAARLVEDLHPDLALLDLSMPVLDGMQTLAKIRRESPGTVVVILTGFLDDDTMRSALWAGAHGCLQKGSDDPTAELAALLDASVVSHLA